tara:strand:- start:492 stop:1013 length:522 start_codon:yes stop_codon:yes gene_type:complete
MKNFFKIMMATLLFAFTVSVTSCDIKKDNTPVSESGVRKATTKVTTGSDGLTVEQRNVSKRLKTDNAIGAIKHLYVISAMSGQTILYSTVDGKVTSGAKRLTTTTKLVSVYQGKIAVPNIQDDGTYGSSMNYLYWWDVKGVYHQHYVTGGQIVHIAEEALPVTDIVINLSTDI